MNKTAEIIRRKRLQGVKKLSSTDLYYATGAISKTYHSELMYLFGRGIINVQRDFNAIKWRENTALTIIINTAPEYVAPKIKEFDLIPTIKI